MGATQNYTGACVIVYKHLLTMQPTCVAKQLYIKANNVKSISSAAYRYSACNWNNIDKHVN